MEVDLRKVGSVAALGETLTRLKHRSGRSLSQLSNATASVGGGGLSRSTLNGYFKGRHLPQQGVGHEFRLLMRELGVCDDAELDAWWATVERLRRGHCDGGRPDNPYPGLRPFDTADTGRFFGRSALTDRLVQQVSVSRASGIPVMVVGPSGIGKSSLLRAGLVSRLSAEGWAPVLMTPGKRPCATLAAQLGQRLELDTDVRQLVAHASSEGADLVQGLTDGEGRDRRCVLIVDQFEEVFSDEVTDDERGLFFAAVRAMTRTAVVVLGLRADFYGHALRHPDLAVALQKSQLVVGPMLESELREAITEPAHMAGFQVEAGLVELLLREMAPSTAPHQVAAHEPGAMPLLSHALQATFEAAVAADTDKILTVQGYRSTGGIHHAVADTAEAAYAALATRGQQLARQVFLRLVHVGEGTADTRRVVDRDELVGQRSDAEAEELDDILDTLVACRLLSAGDRNVQISHEALLVAWPRLRSWLDDDRAGRRLHRRLTHAAREWRNNGRSIDDLYQGRTLTATLAWVAETGQDDLNPLEREFLEASIDKRDAEQESARKRVRRRYQITSAVVVMIVLVAATTIYAWRTQQAADHAAQAALSRDIAAKATRLRSTAPALAAQLAAVAYRSAATVEARSALLDSAANPIPARRHGPTGSTKLVAATSSLTAMASENGTIALARTGEPTVAGPPLRLGSSAVAVALSDDATMLAAVGANGTTHLWDVRDASAPRELATLAGPRGTVTSVAFSPNNRMLAAGDADGTVRLWHLGQHGGSPSPPAMLSGPEAAVTSVAFAPDSQTLAVGSKDGTVHRFDLSDASRPRPLPRLTGPSGEVFSVAISPDGRTLAAGTAKDRAVYLWDIADPHQPRSAGKLTGPTSWVTFIDFSPDGERLIAGSSDSKLWQWSLATRQPLNTLPHPGVITTALYIDNHTVMTLAEDGIIRTWTTTGSVLDDFGDTVYGVDFKPGGRIMAVGPGREDNAIHLVDITNPNAPTPIGVPLTTDASDSELSGPLVISPDGTLLAAGTGDGQVYLWDITTPSRPMLLARTKLDVDATVASLDINHRGTTLAVATKDGTTSLLDITNPRRPTTTATVAATDAALNDIRFSPDGTRIATGSDDGHAYLYDVTNPANPRLLASLEATDGATSLAFNQDGTVLAVGAAADDNVYRWNIEEPAAPTRIGNPLDGPVGDPYQLAFRPGHDQLTVASMDGTIWTWDLTNQHNPRHLTTLTTAADAVTSVAYTPQGTRLAGGSRDGSVHLWPTDPETTIHQICVTSGDTITPAEWDQLLPDTPYQPPCPAPGTPTPYR